MSTRVLFSILLLAGLITALLLLDSNRAGPLTDLEKCSFLLTTSKQKPADVLVVGSSRIAVAVDPVAMQDMLSATYPDLAPRVERIAIPINPMRPVSALIERYIENRGAPKVLVYEIPFLTKRSIDNLYLRHGKKDPEDYIFTRDMSLLSFKQIVNMPSVAMPFSRDEDQITRIHLIVRGLLTRAGMLIYEFFHQPLRQWNLDSCNKGDWRKGGMVWPDDFEFSYAHSRHKQTPQSVVDEYAYTLQKDAKKRSLARWQTQPSSNEFYPYDFESDYRSGELALFQQTIKQASDKGIQLVILPLTLFGNTIKQKDRDYLNNLDENIRLYDLYDEASNLLDTYWYNSAHVTPEPAGIYTTALTAKYIVNNGMLSHD